MDDGAVFLGELVEVEVEVCGHGEVVEVSDEWEWPRAGWEGGFWWF